MSRDFLWVLISCDLNFKSQMKSITKSAFYHFKNIAKCRNLVPSHDLEKLYKLLFKQGGLLQWLFYKLKKTIKQLQLVENAAARAKGTDHITYIKPVKPFGSQKKGFTIATVRTKHCVMATFSYLCCSTLEQSWTLKYFIEFLIFFYCKSLWVADVRWLCYINILAFPWIYSQVHSHPQAS